MVTRRFERSPRNHRRARSGLTSAASLTRGAAENSTSRADRRSASCPDPPPVGHPCIVFRPYREVMIGLWITILICTAATATWVARRIATILRPWRILRQASRLGFVTSQAVPFDPVLVFADDMILGLRSAVRGSILRGWHEGLSLTLYEQSHGVIVDNRPRRITHRIAVVGAPDWPLVTVRPRPSRGRRQRLNGLLLDDRRFNRRFQVVADDSDFAVYLLSPRVQSELAADRTDAYWRFGGGFIARTERGVLRPGDLARMIKSIRALMNHFPEVLRSELQEAHAGAVPDRRQQDLPLVNAHRAPTICPSSPSSSPVQDVTLSR